MSYFPREFLDVARMSPFTAMIRVHDRIWNDKTASLEERMLVCDRIRVWLLEITIEEAKKRMVKKDERTKTGHVR